MHIVLQEHHVEINYFSKETLSNVVIDITCLQKSFSAAEIIICYCFIMQEKIIPCINLTDTFFFFFFARRPLLKCLYYNRQAINVFPDHERTLVEFETRHIQLYTHLHSTWISATGFPGAVYGAVTQYGNNGGVRNQGCGTIPVVIGRNTSMNTHED